MRNQNYKKEKVYVQTKTQYTHTPKNYNIHSNKGITLIALVITIIVMLILVAVTVKTVVDSGLFGHAGRATSSYSMHEAREQLGTTLAGAQVEKYTNKAYDENDYLNKYITDHLPGSKVEGDIAIVDGWAFELDRSVPKIGQNLGKEGTFTYPDLKLEKGTLADDKLSIPIIITAQEAENGISKIEVILNSTVVETFDDCNNSTEEITRTYTATENGTYKVRVYSKINRTGYIKIEEIPEPTPQIGDYVKYTPDPAEPYLMEGKYNGYSDQSIPQDTTLNWKIMNINEDGRIELISEKPTNTYVYFEGALGFNNGVYLLNDLCKAQYSNADYGAVGRSIDLEDIENRMTAEGITAKNNAIRYSKTFSGSDSYSPDIYDHVDKTTEGDSLDYYEEPTTATYTNKGSLFVENTNYSSVIQRSSYYDSTEFYNLIFKTGNNYWLASRYAFCSSDSGAAYFGLRMGDNSSITSRDLFLSNGCGYNYDYRIRPVVTLGSEFRLQKVEGSSEWQIVRK